MAGISDMQSGLFGWPIDSKKSGIKNRTPVVLTEGRTFYGFTGIPSWVNRITFNFSGISANGTSIQIVQMGCSGGIEVSGYVGSTAGATWSEGIRLQSANDAASTWTGTIILSLIDASTNTWCSFGNINSTIGASLNLSGRKSLSGTLDRVRLTTENGTDVFDAGKFNILYE
jgi:hypothetical protein